MTKEFEKRISELENSLSIALENVEKYQRNRPLDSMDEIAYRELQAENKKLKKRAEEAEGEVTIVKGIGLNSPEMKALQKENERLKKVGNQYADDTFLNQLEDIGEIENLQAELAREKEEHQYDNLVHANELKNLKSKKHRINQK